MRNKKRQSQNVPLHWWYRRVYAKRALRKFWPRRRLAALRSTFFLGKADLSALRTCAPEARAPPPHTQPTKDSRVYFCKDEASNRTRDQNALREARLLLRQRHNQPDCRPSRRLRPQRLPRTGNFTTLLPKAKSSIPFTHNSF